MSVQNSIYNKVIFCDNNVKNGDDVKKVSELNIAEKITSIKEMANSLEKSNIQEHKKYNFAVVCGHAAPGMQGLGSNRSANYVKGKDFSYDALDDIDMELDKIANSLDTTKKVKPVLFLAGCGAGEGSDGSLLLTGISTKLRNVLVVGSQDHLTFKQSYIEKKLVSVDVLRLIKNRADPATPPEFKFAFNGRIINERSVSKKAGVDKDTLLNELKHFDNKL